MKTVECYAVGSVVSLDNGNVRDGIITAVCVRQHGVSYEVSWWDGRQHKCEWLTADEVKDDKAEKIKLGFGNAR
jgi:hypothetical protein